MHRHRPAGLAGRWLAVCWMMAPAACSSSGSTSSSAPAATTAAPTTSAPTPTTPSTSTTTTITPTTTAPTTAAPTTTAAAPAAGDYTPAPGPDVPAQTDPIDPSWVQPDGSLVGVVDGTYWGRATGEGNDPQPHVVFRLVQAFFGDACRAQFPSDDTQCTNDSGTLEQPAGMVSMDVASVTMSVADAVTQQSYAISGPELQRLVAGGPPSDAPAEFIYVPFAYLLKVSGGQVVSAYQVWTP